MQTILNLWQENGTLSMIIQIQIMLQQMIYLQYKNYNDYNDAYILVTADIAIIGHQVIQVAFKIVHHLLNVSQKLMKQK